MAKNKKAPLAGQGKPITAFFALCNKTSNSMTGTPAGVSMALGSQLPKQSMATKLTSKPMSGVTSLPRSEMRTHLQAETSLKHGQARLESPATSLNPHVEQRNKFDADSEYNASDAIIFVNSANPQQRKRTRLSSPTELFRSSYPDLVPSSQSDEDELPSNETLTIGDTINGSMLPTHRDETDDLTMSVDDHSPIVDFESQEEVLNIVQPPSQGQMLTPPSGDLSSIPPTPVVLQNAMGRTAKDLIDEIKARAYAKSLSSPEYDKVDFKEELASSDDETLPDLLPPTLKPNRRSTRHDLKNRTGSLTMRTRLLVMDQAVAAKRTVTDPFAALLREKKQAEKSGTGSSFIISQAEMAITQPSKACLLDEMDSEEGLASEEWVAVSSASIRGILNSRPRREGDDDVNQVDEDNDKLRDEDGRKTVLEILEQDKTEKRIAGSSGTMLGIRLWTTTTHAKSPSMVVNQRHRIPGCSTFIQLVNRSLDLSDPARAITLLSMDLMMSLQPTERAAAASALGGIALSTPSSLLADAAVNALEKFWSSTIPPASSTICFQDCLSCLIHLGFRPSLIEAHGWRDEVRSHIILGGDRDIVLHRLVVLVTACARSRRLRQAELPDMITAIMLLGMGSETQPDLCRDMVEAIDFSMRCLSPDESISRQNEFIFCKKILTWSASYLPVNKLRLLSLLSNASGPTRRIATFVAYCIITDQYSPTSEMYLHAPSLLAILEQLEPYSKSSGRPPGKFALYAGTDYMDLGFYTAILGIAISDLKDYINQERQRPRHGAPSSPGRVGEKPKTELQLLHAALELLHSKILDSRAAHLERSRTKAAIKQLAMKIHYQRENWVRNNQDNRSKTLAQYFTKS